LPLLLLLLLQLQLQLQLPLLLQLQLLVVVVVVVVVAAAVAVAVAVAVALPSPTHHKTCHPERRRRFCRRSRRTCSCLLSFGLSTPKAEDLPLSVLKPIPQSSNLHRLVFFVNQAPQQFHQAAT
jgi:predicted transglutaminase-like cysteine proteinase